MLAFYSERFNSTEVNYTFKRYPTEKILTNWVSQTPAQFQFTLKAPQEIMHFRRLRDCETKVKYFADVSQALGPKLDAVLFQLPPDFGCDLPLLRDFISVLPPGMKAAFEFRNESWWCDEVFSALRAANCALCIGDSEKSHTPVVFTAKHAYFRLRDEGYGPDDIKRWAEEVRRAEKMASDVCVYFKHEESGLGPKFAAALRKLLND